MAKEGSFEVKVGLAEMLKGGVIMDVMNADQAKIAEDAGAVAVMALERIPALIREEGGIARASDPQMIKDIQKVNILKLKSWLKKKKEVFGKTPKN